jgi:hypothetical protein
LNPDSGIHELEQELLDPRFWIWRIGSQVSSPTQSVTAACGVVQILAAAKMPEATQGLERGGWQVQILALSNHGCSKAAMLDMYNVARIPMRARCKIRPVSRFLFD